MLSYHLKAPFTKQKGGRVEKAEKVFPGYDMEDNVCLALLILLSYLWYIVCI